MDIFKYTSRPKRERKAKEDFFPDELVIQLQDTEKRKIYKLSDKLISEVSSLTKVRPFNTANGEVYLFFLNDREELDNFCANVTAKNSFASKSFFQYLELANLNTDLLQLEEVTEDTTIAVYNGEQEIQVNILSSLQEGEKVFRVTNHVAQNQENTNTVNNFHTLIN